jgi:AcrR family transcriptional regulator
MQEQERHSDRKDQRRRLIVETARAAFFRNGYGGTTMSSIAADLGGSKATLWSYFRNKQDLFTAVIDDMVERYGEALRMPLPAEGDPVETLRRFASSLMKTIMQPEIIALHRMVTGEAGRFPELGRLLYERGPGRGQARMADWMAQLMQRGALRAADAVTASRHFAGLCQSGAFQRLLIGAGGKPKSAQVKEEIDAAVDAFMRAYGT